MKKPVAIIMGSDSDWSVMENAEKALDSLGVACHVEVVSAHRTPEKMREFAKSAESKGFKVIIAGAGGSAHLPGMVACFTTLPVIGVPVTIGSLKGLDALMSIVQMPKGIPVATVAIDNAFNAGLLAAQILGTTDKKLSQKIEKFRDQQIEKVANMNRNLKKRKK